MSTVQAMNLPPGPKGMPYFGSLKEIRENPMFFYTRISQRYGGIVRFLYGRNPTYLVSEPSLIKELVVTNKDRYVKNQRYPALKRLIGDGLLLSEGETWQRQRKSSQAGLRARIIQGQVGWMADVAEELLDAWSSFPDRDEPVDIEPEVLRMSQTLTGYWILGPQYRELGPRVNRIIWDAWANWPTPPTGLFGHWKPPAFKKIRSLKRALGELDEVYFAAIARQRQSGDENYSLLSHLMRNHDEATYGPMTDQDLRDQLVTLFMAGYETSAALQAWLWYLVSGNPHVRRRLHAEVDEVLGGRHPTWDDLGALIYTEQVVKEALRLYPPAYTFSRVPVVDDNLGGYHVPAGTMVVVSTYATHRFQPYWPNPEGFDPDRFTRENSDGRPNFAFIPFGAGPRVCVGAGLAMVQAKILVAMTAQRFSLDLEASHRVEPAPGTVMRPRWGMPMRVHRR